MLRHAHAHAHTPTHTHTHIDTHTHTHILPPTDPRSQVKKKRQYGNEAVKSHILAAKTVANIVKTSLVRPPAFACPRHTDNPLRAPAVSTRSSSPPTATSP
jgi:hypothetical protein